MRENEDLDRPPKHLWRSDEEEEGEDPLVTLGHMVKLASIGIWRKVSSKGGKTRPDLVVVDEPVTDTSEGKPSLPQGEETTKTAGDEVVVVQTQPVSTIPTPTKEP